MERIHQFARQHLKLSSDCQKRNYDHRPVNHHRYDKGNVVWLYSPWKKKGICPKLIRQFDGPYLVMKRRSDILVLSRIQKGAKSKPKVLHHDHLKPYRGPNAPPGCPRVVPPSRQSPTELQKIQVKLPVRAPSHGSLLQWSPGILQVLNWLLYQLCDALEERLDPCSDAGLPVRLDFLNAVPLSNIISFFWEGISFCICLFGRVDAGRIFLWREQCSEARIS